MFQCWLKDGLSIRILMQLYRLSRATVQRHISYWLDHPPKAMIFSTTATTAIFDGSVIKHRRGPYVALDAKTHSVIAAVDNISEGGRELLAFYQRLADAGVMLTYATIDGNTQQNKYLRRVWPEIIIQRCVVHVQRQGLSWCRQTPKRTDAKHLRKLFLELSHVKTPAQIQQYLRRVELWEHRFGALIQHTPERGYVFSDLKRARSMLLKALPNLFHFIGNPEIASSTNALEGYFSRLKEQYRRHRGFPTSIVKTFSYGTFILFVNNLSTQTEYYT